MHGDVKPDNVLLSGSGVVKLGDFGGSQFFDRRDTFNRTLGTPAYLAPEVCAGKSYRGTQADVWALGCSLYLFCYGEMPFKGDSVLDLYDAIATKDVNYPRSKPISYELQDLFLRCLHKDPQHRITMAEVMQHPWVTGGAWQALLPDLSGSPESRDARPDTAQPMDVAAVIFPEMVEGKGQLGLRATSGLRTCSGLSCIRLVACAAYAAAGPTL